MRMNGNVSEASSKNLCKGGRKRKRAKEVIGPVERGFWVERRKRQVKEEQE